MGNAFGVFVPYVSKPSDCGTDSTRSAKKSVVVLEEGDTTVDASVDFIEKAINTSVSPRELRRRRRLGLQS